MIKIYFDESGQSGCVLQKKDLLNFEKQPTFAIGAVVAQTEDVSKKLTDKYLGFKENFNIDGEIKGTKLLTREYNDELEYVLKNIIDRYHCFVMLYDKRFYISTLLLLSLIGFEYQHTMPEHFYRQATMLSQQKDDFFVQYLKYIEKTTMTEFSSYLDFLINYNYINMDGTENAVKIMAQEIKKKGIEDKCYDDFLTFGSYEDPKITNLINLTALSELIYFIKSQLNISNKEIVYIHDHIGEFEKTIKGELKEYGIDIEFADSKQEIMLQLADNIASIARHSYDNAISIYKKREQWEEQSGWKMRLLARMIKKVSSKHISFTVPLNDWAAALCAEIMFDTKYPKKDRNNIHFNYYYGECLRRIFMSIGEQNCPIEDIVALLGK